SELLLISVIALVVLGPERLPKLAAQVGRWVGKARSMARQFREQLESEVNIDDLSKPQPSKPANTPSWPPADDPAPSENTIHAQPDPDAPSVSDQLSTAHLSAEPPPATDDSPHVPEPATPAHVYGNHESHPYETPAAHEFQTADDASHDDAHHPEGRTYGAQAPRAPSPAPAVDAPEAGERAHDRAV
ncbi:MAG: twin-arginine translocase subunit TatB, partial [Proteobacteria bacterium]